MYDMPKLAINGGKKTYDGAWPTWPVWGDPEREALSGVLESGKWWYGQRVNDFEREFSQFQDARFGVTTTSGSTALEVALRALGIGAGDEVIIPPYTFVATAAAVIWVGATPVFADIEPHTLCIDPDDVARKITARTKAIIPVHLAGHVADMDRLWALAQTHGLRIIEDACHAWGSKWKGKGAGALGDCGAFSFQMSKNICSAEGGIILTDDEELADTCRSLTNCGRLKGSLWYEHGMAGSNLRMTEFQAALLSAQLARATDHMLTRRRNALILNERLAKIPGVRVFSDDPRITRRAYHLYCFQIDPKQLGISRTQFLDALTAEGVPASGGYLTPLYCNPAFTPGGDGEAGARFRPQRGGPLDYSKTSCPVTEHVCETVCWFSHVLLLADEAAIHAAADAVANVCQNAREIRHVEVAVHHRTSRAVVGSAKG
jgi:dTDP-4-amino-4,6-dideoxygalactose transaminase